MVKLNIYVETTILTEEFYNSTKKEKEKIVNELKKNIFEYIYEKYDFVEIISEEYSIIESIEGPYKKFMPYVKFLGSWKNFEEQNYRCIEYNLVKAREEKNQRIAELEKEVEELKKQDIEHLYDKELLIRVAKDSNNNAKLTYKALELACDTHQFEDTCDYCPYNEERLKTNACPCSCEDEPYFNRDCAINYFIQQSEKELGDKES